MIVNPKFRPVLDPEFVPASLWNRAFRARVNESPKREQLVLALQRRDGSVSVHRTAVLPHEGANVPLNERFAERLLKMLLWQKGGSTVRIDGPPGLVRFLQCAYSPSGRRQFDFRFMGETVDGVPMRLEQAAPGTGFEEQEIGMPLGRHLEGCRIGFDLGASDRKCAAVVDGVVVFTQEVPWNPSVQADPQYHYDGIDDSLRRAAAHLPRVDSIGGSAAGVYVNNEVRVASLFRGVPPDLYQTRVRRLFFELQAAWGGIPFEVVNDGEVTALAGSIALDDNAVLGIAMGSSLAAGYVTPRGTITNWLNELAFAPVDYREHAPVDEWSGDEGVGVQYFSQQAVARLAPAAGIEFPQEMPFAERLVDVQNLLARGDERARKIYETIGTYFGYAIAHFADFYELRNLLVLGRVMSGEGGSIIVLKAAEVLNEEFPELAARLRIDLPDEKQKRHGQAVAAASLPRLKRPRAFYETA